MVRASLALLGLGLALGALVQHGQAQAPARDPSVLQHHGSAIRDGHYVEAAFTRAAAAQLRRDPRFHAPVSGPTYAQPLFLAAGRAGEKDVVIVATERNEVTAFDAATGGVIWRRSLGTPVDRRRLPCGNIDPLGITGTPIVDRGSGTLFVGAMTTPDGGATKKHLIAALAVGDGSMRPGWPVDVSRVRAGGVSFDSAVQNQRGALALLGGTLYVPYGGHYGDCGDYHGWVVGVPLDSPSSPRAWATRARGGGIWAPGGIASDGRALYVATGNTFGAKTWSDGEAVLRLAPGPTFSQQPADFFAPTDWAALDDRDADLGGSGPLLVTVPGARPSELVIALGKDGRAYLIDRQRMGGIGGAVTATQVADSPIITAAAIYATARGSYVVFKARGHRCPAGRAGDLTAVKIDATSPPTVSVAWCADQHGLGSPIVTTTDGRAESIVWSVGAEGDNRLHGFDGDTGAVVFDGGGRGEAMGRVRRYETPIVAAGRIFVAGDDELYAFALSR